MSDGTDNTSATASGATAEAPPLAADPDEQREVPPRRKFSFWMLLLWIPGLLLLVLSVVGFLMLLGGGEGRPEDDPVHRLSLDVAGTRADMQLLEERLAQVEALEARLNELNQRLEEREAGVRDELAGMRGYGERLEALEEQLDRVSSQAEVRMAAFDERLETVITEAEAAVAEAEQEAEQARQQAEEAVEEAVVQAEARARRATQSTRPAAPPRPPFRISAVESRGGRSYLSIATGSGRVGSLDQVQLLGEREALGEWQLVTIGGATAEFLYRGSSVNVPLP